MKPTLLKECMAETIGTFLLVLFGCGSVIVSLMTGSQLGLLGVAAVWGFAVSLAIYVTQTMSGAHLNPAITISMVLYRRETFQAKKSVPYICAQVTGAILAGATLYALFYNVILAFEQSHHLIRGADGSQLSAMIFGEYFPNPGLYGTDAAASSQISVFGACVGEAIGTALLAFAVFSLTDKKNPVSEKNHVVPVVIGLTVSIIIIIIAPLTQAGLNPARDLGPRLFSYLAGWNSIAIPGPRGGFFTVYIASPILGAITGGGIYSLLYNYSGFQNQQSLDHKELNVAPKLLKND